MLLIFLSAAPMSKTWGWVQVCLNEWKWYFTAIQSSLLKHVRLKMLLWQFSINIRTLIIITLIINIDVQISQCSNGFFLVCGEFQNSIVSTHSLAPGLLRWRFIVGKKSRSGWIALTCSWRWWIVTSVWKCFKLTAYDHITTSSLVVSLTIHIQQEEPNIRSSLFTPDAKEKNKWNKRLVTCAITSSMRLRFSLLSHGTFFCRFGQK